jgi:hypothetical protein
MATPVAFWLMVGAWIGWVTTVLLLGRVPLGASVWAVGVTAFWAFRQVGRLRARERQGRS